MDPGPVTRSTPGRAGGAQARTVIRRLLPPALLVALLLGACASPPRAGDLVTLDTGTARGTVDAGNRVFRDLPFAAPPVGDLRWAPPAPPAPWDGVRDATASGPPCPQAPKAVAEIASEDEDCLTLEVTTPRAAGPPRPVLVWVHGGTGTNGAGSAFDARRFARDADAVLVTVNYRLGVFGAFGHPDLPEAGTLGLADQQAALRWVRRNVAAFGGDPAAVTVVGESFGAYGLTAQLTSPPAAGLFRGAVLQSGLALHDYPAGTIAPGSPPVPTLWSTRAEAEALGAWVAGQVGCADLACLRALPARDLLPFTDLFTRYVAGTAVLPEDPVAALAAGRFHRVPVLSGGTRDEHRLYTAAFYDLAGRPVTAEGYRDLLDTAFGADADAVAAEYPLTAFASPGLAWSAVVTDRLWALAQARQDALLAAHTTVHRYEYADPAAPPVIPFPPGFPPGAHHSSEVFSQFDAPGSGEFGATAGGFTAAQRAFAGELNGIWGAFARTGDPGWAPGPVQALAPGASGPVDHAALHRLPFWERITSR